MNTNIVPHSYKISRDERTKNKNHLPAVLWFTGLSGSGKSTIADKVEQLLLNNYQAHTYLLDGDNIRNGINQDLSFGNQDRSENIRRVAEISSLMFDAGLIVLTAFISPFRQDRNLVRNKIPTGNFIEIFVDCPIDVCESRDPKGLYKKARAGEITQFTGISSPYESPNNPEITIKSNLFSIDECATMVINVLEKNKLIERNRETK
jgi:adenylylsulfate kinase